MKNMKSENEEGFAFQKTSYIKNTITKDGSQFFMQYHNSFIARLQAIQKLYEQNYKDLKFGQVKDLKQTDDIYIIGVVQKRMPNFISYLKWIERPEFSELEQKFPQQINSLDDEVCVEDESGKIELSKESKIQVNQIPSFRIDSLTTGCIICVKGIINEEGQLDVTDMKFLNISSQKMQIEPQKSSEKTLLLSSLNLNSTNMYRKSCQKLRQIFTQDCGGILKDVNSMILFGGIFKGLSEKNLEQLKSYLFRREYEQVKNEMSQSFEFVDTLVESFIQLQQNRQVLIAPSIDDPTNSCLPQKPLNEVLFTKCGMSQQLMLLQNPDIIKTSSGQTVLLLDGKFVKDYMRQSNLDFKETIILFMKLGLICPSAPNTMDMMPSEEASLVLRVQPDFVLVSEAKNFEQFDILDDSGDLYTTVVLVQSFNTQRKALVYDFVTKGCNIISFVQFNSIQNFYKKLYIFIQKYHNFGIFFRVFLQKINID